MLSYGPTSYLIISETFCSFFALISCDETWNVPRSLAMVRYMELYQSLIEQESFWYRALVILIWWYLLNYTQVWWSLMMKEPPTFIWFYHWWWVAIVLLWCRGWIYCWKYVVENSNTDVLIKCVLFLPLSHLVYNIMLINIHLIKKWIKFCPLYV